MKVQSNPGKKKATLDGYCEVFVMSDEVSDSEETHKNLLEAQVDVEEWKQKETSNRFMSYT